MADPRIVYGAGCSWWDSIDKVAKTASGLPCCPHCGGVLFEVANEARWWRDVQMFESEHEPGYRKFIEWLRGRCFPGPAFLDKARNAYALTI
jgi:hypothetical protein